MKNEFIFIFLSAISAVFSLLVVLTGIIWPNYMLSKNRPFSAVIFFISFSDLFASIFNCFGFPQSGTELCSAQAFGYLYFIPSCWLWTLLLVFLLRTVIIHKCIQLSFTWMHCICWSIPLIPTFAPLSTNRYGQDDSLNGNAPCVFGGNVNSKYIWIVTCDTGLAFLCFVLMIIWSIEIYLFLLKSKREDTIRERSLFNSMKLYPLALFVTWIPTFALGLATLSNPSYTDDKSLVLFIVTFATQYGTLQSIIYFSQSSVARQLWMNLLRRKFCQSQLFMSNHNNSMDTGETDYAMESRRLISSCALESDEDILVERALSRENSIEIVR